MTRKKEGTKIKKKPNKLINQIIWCVYFAVGITMLVLGIFSFTTGFHNMDQGQNMRYINARFNISIVDVNNRFETWSATEMYINGYNQTVMGLLLSILGAFGLGCAYITKF